MSAWPRYILFRSELFPASSFLLELCINFIAFSQRKCPCPFVGALEAVKILRLEQKNTSNFCVNRT